MDEVATATKAELHRSLREARASLLSRLDGLGEYDLRRPMTGTGTNLLGVVKHLASVEYGYFGGVFGRPAPEQLRCHEDGSIWQGADMWAATDESRDYIIGFYRRACAHADDTIDALDLDATGTVSWWAEGQQATTLGVILVRMHGETCRHAGHIDIVRELIDGYAGEGNDLTETAFWRDFLARVRAAADAFHGK